MKLPEQEKYAIDVVAGVGTGAAWLGWLPDIVAVATLVWVLIRIWETETAKSLFRKLRGKR